MRLYLLYIEMPTRAGMLSGRDMPYETRHGIPVGYPETAIPADGDVIGAPPGMTVVHSESDVDQLYTIDGHGESIPLPLRLEPVDTGLQRLVEAESVAPAADNSPRVKVRGTVVSSGTDSEGQFTVIEQKKPE